jgi:hypothetical protein
MDYNLFGMNFIHLKSIKFRRIPKNEEESITGENLSMLTQMVSNKNDSMTKKWILTNSQE